MLCDDTCKEENHSSVKKDYQTVKGLSSKYFICLVSYNYKLSHNICTFKVQAYLQILMQALK